MFKTIENDGEADITEKKSKFIANVFYIKSITEAEEKIKQIKRKNNTARHHCYAYRIANDTEIISKSNDDGEPAGTAGHSPCPHGGCPAGMPILNILEKNDLVNMVVIVTRYFGGILLGTGGLVKAYSESTLKAIGNAKIVFEEEGVEIEIKLNYQDLEKFKYYCNKNNINVVDIKYSDCITCLVETNFVEKEKIMKETSLKILEYKIIRKKCIRKNVEK